MHLRTRPMVDKPWNAFRRKYCSSILRRK